MTVTAVSPEIKAPNQQASPRQYLSYLIFILCVSFYLLPLMRVLRQGTDEGLLIDGAVRVFHGQVFPRDFFEVVGPGTFYWLAIFFKLFGVTFLATRICLFVSSLGTTLLLYFLTRRVCRTYQSLPSVLVLGTYFGALWPTISHHVDSNFFALLTVACMVLWQDRRKNSLLIVGGVLAGATTCFLQPKGLLLLVALLLWLWIQRQRRYASISALYPVMGGYCGVIGIVMAYFWSQGALWDLIYLNFLWPFQHYGAVNVVPYARGIVFTYWNCWATVRGALHWPTAMAAVLIIPFLFVAALPALLLLLGVRHKWNTVSPEIALYSLCGAALWLSEIHRKDIFHLVFGSPLLIILCIHLLVERREKIADFTLQILAISAACLAGFNFFLVLTAHPVITRVGSVAVFKTDPVLALLEKKVPPGEETFVYPYAPMYYFLSATTNPTRYSLLMYNYNTATEFRETVKLLERHQVRYVVWDTGYYASTLKTFFPSAKPPRPDELIMEPYLESHYSLVKAEGGIRVMERKNRAPVD